MWTVDGVIDEAIEKLDLPKEGFLELEREDAEQVVAKAREKYVKGNPRVWWTGLKFKPQSKDTDPDDLSYLDAELEGREELFYFVPENESDAPRVFRVNLDGLKALLAECVFFEYNLVGPGFNWLIIENDHNELLVVDE